MDTIQELWLERVKAHLNLEKKFMTEELPLRAILLYLVSEGVALDPVKAKMAVELELGGPPASSTNFSFGEFKSLFCRGIFKQALISNAEEFTKTMQTSANKSGQQSDLNPRQQINSF